MNPALGLDSNEFIRPWRIAMSAAPQNPIDTDAPLTNFSQCHAGILRHLNDFGQLPELLEPAQRLRQIAERFVEFFREAVFEHHQEEERELFPAVLASAEPGPERHTGAADGGPADARAPRRRIGAVEAGWSRGSRRRWPKASRHDAGHRRPLSRAGGALPGRTPASRSRSFLPLSEDHPVAATATTWRRWACRCTCGISRCSSATSDCCVFRSCWRASRLGRALFFGR
jgi:hypothetical protein